MRIKKPNKRKLNIDGTTYKVEKPIHDLIYQLESRITNHTLALYNYMEVYIKKEGDRSEMEELLYKYCMQLPLAEEVEAEIKETLNGTEDNN